MKYISKSLSVLLIAVMLVALPFSITKADSSVIYTSSAKETITSGATLERLTRFTTEGWLNINVLRVDLSNPNIKVDTLSDASSIKNLSNTKALAQSRGAVAAVNGGFFNWLKGGGAYTDGPLLESGKVISADNEYNRYSDSMGTLSINDLNELLYNYWKTDISLVAANGASTVVMQYNKPSKLEYKDFTILDRRWSENSLGNIYNDIVEMIVDNGKVAEIRKGQPSVKIPENGYAVITRQAGEQFINTNFKVGDSVNFNIKTNPDWSNLKMAVTGSSILVKEGQIPARFSFSIPGRHPRTAIGSTKDGSRLLLVTVDGRQQSSIGMTETELAQFMLEIGAYNALNLDGGGSTTMVARTSGNDDLEIVNNPSDGTPRSISNAVGIFSIAPPSVLDGFIIETLDTNVFVNTSREFRVKGYDRYFNPISIDVDKVQWDVSGVEGYFEGSVFHPQSEGDGIITASLGGVSSQLLIRVLGSPAGLELGERSLRLTPGQTKSFNVKGRDKYGYAAPINPLDITWDVSGNVGEFHNGVFTAKSSGTGYIEASIGETHVYCGISVASSTSEDKDGFESGNGTFISYPTSVTGNYEISTQQKHSGKASGKLTYDFTSNLSEKRAAYLKFPDTGISLGSDASSLGLWVYNDHVNSNWLAALISDANGQSVSLYFSKALDWTGWKYVEVPLQGVKLPARLTRLYTVQVSPVAESGSLYFDDLSISIAGSYLPVDESGIPQDTLPVDEANIQVSLEESPDSFRFSVFGESRQPRNLLERILLLRLVEKINGKYEASGFVGALNHDLARKTSKPYAAADAGYKSFDIKGSRFIQLDMSKQGLRSSNAAQWSWFLQQLESAEGSNVFIFMANAPGTFSDKLEAALFQDVLVKYREKTDKNVWVFYKGDKNLSYMDRGIRYVTSAGFDIDGLSPDNTEGAIYVLVTVKDGNATFEFKPIVK